MRNDLYHIEQIEKYLNGKLSSEDLYHFESRLKTDLQLQQDVELQRKLVNRIQENAFKNELAQFHSQFLVQEKSFNFRKLVLNTGIGLFFTSITALSIYYFLSRDNNQNHQDTIPAPIVNNANNSSVKTKIPTEVLEESLDAPLLATTSNQPKRTKFNPPLTGSGRGKAEEIPCRKFLMVFNEKEIDASVGADLKMENATIHLPPDIFVDKNGNLVNGKVEIHYREFRNSAQMAFSQIPMNYNENGEQYNFNSLGMFEIRAFQNEEELFVAKGKKFTVDYSCTQSLDTTYFFALNDKTNQWSKINEIDFKEEQRVTDSLLAQKNQNRIKNKNAQLFARVNDVSTGKLINAKFEVLNSFSESLVPLDLISDSNYVAYEWSNSSFSAEVKLKITAEHFEPLTINKVYLERGKISIIDAVMKPEVFEKEKSKQSFFKRLFSKSSKVVLQEKYYSKAAVRDTVSQAADINPKNWNGSDLNTNNPNSLMNINLNLVRGLACNSFGVYNCDQIYKLDKKINIQSKFVDESGELIQNTFLLSLIDLKFNGAFPFQTTNFSCSANGKNVLLLFTNDKKMYAITSDDFSAMKIKKDGEYTFKMKDITELVKNTKDLELFLNLKSV